MKLYITNGVLERAMNAPASNSILWDIDFTEEHLHIPEGVVRIGKNVFQKNYGITAITLPDSLKYMDAGALANCTHLKQIFLSPNHPTFRLYGKYLISKDNVLIRALSDVEEAIIPEGIVRIEESAFFDCVNLRTVFIPSSVTTIGKRAFYWCACLTDCHFSEGLLSIEEEAFVLCKQLTHILLPSSLVRLGTEAFAQCSQLKTLTLPDSLSEMGGGITYACNQFEQLELSESHPHFHKNGNLLIKSDSTVIWAHPALTEVIVPQGITQIADKAFKWCTQLKTLTLPDSLISIGEEAFFGCFTLKEIQIPHHVEYIGQRAFYDCEALTTLHLPASIREIGAEAFCDCLRLTTLSMKKGIVHIGRDAFGYYHFTSFDVPEEYFLPTITDEKNRGVFYPFQIQLIPQALISSACRCFLNDPSLYPIKVHEGYFQEISRRADELMKEVFDHPKWLHKMIEQNLIPDESIDAYLNEATCRGNEECISKLQARLRRRKAWENRYSSSESAHLHQKRHCRKGLFPIE